MNIFAMPEEQSPSERIINAASFGRVEDLQEAIDAGGDPNFLRLDISPTLICTMRQYLDCLEILVNNGAHCDIPNRAKWTALHEAAQREDREYLEVILSKPEQTRITVRDNNGYTALRVAMQADSFENAQLLYKADNILINLADNEGVSPALWAAKEKKIEWLEWCLRRGADPKQTDESGLCVSSVVSDWPEGKELLESLGAMVIEQQKNKTSSQSHDVSNQEEKEEQEEKKSNPFGLGKIKKKNMS